ncbi:MAG: hypothetical protein WBR15_01065 [Gammaproteobacteria bacterium]
MRRLMLAALLLLPAYSVFASDNINDLPALNQGQFSDLSHDLSAVTTYKELEAATSEGIAGFDFGFAYSVTNLAHQSAWDTAGNGGDVSNVSLARLSVSKGLPFGFDIGGYYGYSPNTSLQAYGAELRYAILDGGALEPALGIRATYNWLSGVNQLSFNSRSLDLTLSKGIGPFTPYAGVGQVWANSNPDASTGLRDVSFTAGEAFVGFRLNLLVANLSVEGNRTAGNNTYGVKLAFSF